MSKKKNAKKAVKAKKNPVLRYLSFELGEFRSFADTERFNTAFTLLLALLALLPALAFIGYVRTWIVYGEMASQDEVGNTFVYWGAYAYHHIFLFATIPLAVVVLAYLLAFPPRFDRFRLVMRQEPWHGFFLFILFWAALGMLRSEDPWKEFFGSALQYDGFSTYLLITAVYLAAFFLREKGDRLLILRLYTGVANFSALLMLGQQYKWPVIYDVLFHTNSSVFYNLNHFSYYLAVSIGLLAGLFLYDTGKRRSVWYLSSYIFQIFVLLVNGSLGSIGAVLAGCIALPLFHWRSGRRRSLRLILVIVVFLLMCMGNYFKILPVGPNGSLSSDADLFIHGEVESILSGVPLEHGGAGHGRSRLWREALEIYHRAPILGFGPNGIPDDYDVKLSRPHNAFLQVLMIHGIPGLLAYIAALVSLLVIQWKKLRELDETVLMSAVGVTVYLAAIFFGVPMYHTTVYYFLLLGFAASREPGNPLLRPQGKKKNSAASAVSLKTADSAYDRSAEPSKTAEHPQAIHWKRLAVMLAVALSVFGLAVYIFAVRVESQLEEQDLIFMHLAYRQGQLAIVSDGLAEPAELWFEPDEGILLDGPAPAAYGAGTALRGHRAFTEEELGPVNYRTDTDYSGRVLKVILDPAYGKDGVALEWVEIPGDG